jgi:hypothetical protein
MKRTRRSGRNPEPCAAPLQSASGGTPPHGGNSGTVLYGEYTQYLDQIGPAALNAGVTGSEFTRWGFGAVQEIDSASMSLWIKYRQHDGELTGGAFDGGLDAFRYVSTGGIIISDRIE